MLARLSISLVVILFATAAMPVSAGGKDLHPDREKPRSAERQREQELQKAKLLARLRADAPTQGAERRPPANPLDLPIFGGRPALTVSE